jgi:hypothetical protein
MHNKTPQTPLDHAAKLRYDLIQWDKLTQQDITKRDKKGTSFLMHIVNYGHWTNLPPKLKEFSLTQPTWRDDKLIHQMAKQGKANTIPKELVTEELLALKGNEGESAYHLLAQETYANHIDKSLWTRKTLTLTSHAGRTPLHSIVQYQPELLPEDITLDDLLLKNRDEETPIYLWARGSLWAEIPDKFLTKQTLELKVGYGDFETLMHHIANRFKNDQVLYGTNYNNPLDTKMKKLLCRIGNNLLQSLGKDEDPSLSRHLNAELAKRKMIKELSQSEQCIEI